MSYSIIPTEHIALCFLGSPNAGWGAELPAVGHLSLSLLYITKCPLSRCLCFLFVSSCTDFCLASSLHTNRQQDRCFLALVLLKVSSCHQYDPLWHYCIIKYRIICWLFFNIATFFFLTELETKECVHLNLFKWHDKRKVVKGVMTCLLIIYFITSRVHINDLWIKPGLSGFLWKVLFLVFWLHLWAMALVPKEH